MSDIEPRDLDRTLVQINHNGGLQGTFPCSIQNRTSNLQTLLLAADVSQSADMVQFEQTFEAYIDSFSGASGAVVANLLFYPLENLRTRVQALRSKKQKKNGEQSSKDGTGNTEAGQIDSSSKEQQIDRSLGLIEILIRIIKKEGIFAMYTGLQAALFGTVVSYGIYFWWYRFLKNKFTLMTGRKNFTKGEITMITLISGTLSSFFGNPIWMLNTRMIDKKKEEAKVTYGQMIREIYQNEGLWAFYKGFVPNFILVLNPIINFVIYEGIRNAALKKYKDEKFIPFWVTFMGSSIGKIIATFATFPILTIRVWAHTNKFAEMEGNSTMHKILKFIQTNGVIGGLYKGVEAKLLQTVLYNAFMMMVYEYLRLFVKRFLFYTVYLKLKKK